MIHNLLKSKSNRLSDLFIDMSFHFIALDLKKAEVYKGEPKSGKADTTLTVDDKDMVAIVRRLN